MSQPNSFDEEAFRNYMEELPDLLTGEGNLGAVVARYPTPVALRYLFISIEL